MVFRALRVSCLRLFCFVEIGFVGFQKNYLWGWSAVLGFIIEVGFNWDFVRDVFLSHP